MAFRGLLLTLLYYRHKQVSPIAITSVNAILVKNNDIEEISKAILLLATRHDLRKNYGLKSRELVESDMSEEFVIKNTLSLYKNLYESIS